MQRSALVVTPLAIKASGALIASVSPSMDEYRLVLRRVGWLLVAVGLADICFMAYCIVNEINYSSSFNIFSVIAGVFLLRGHLGAAKLVTWFSAFMFSGFAIGSLVLFPWLQPADYWLLLIRKEPLQSLFLIGVMAAVLAGLFWVYVQLRSPSVVAARVSAGQKAGRPISAFMAGGALVVALAVIFHITMNGEMGQKAMRLAAQKCGSDYKYFISSMHWGGGHVTARLTAYNSYETKEVSVEWDD